MFDSAWRYFKPPSILIWSILFVFTRGATPHQAVLGDLRGQEVNNNKLGAVASENKVCSQIGIDLLKAGGNAADALVGTVLCVGVIDSHHSGLGGGGFALIRAANGSYEAVDFRETAPSAAFEDMFKNNVLGSILGGLASGVPGEPSGLYYIHKNYGVLPWSILFQPAIKLAREGFVISKDFANAMDLVTDYFDDEFLSKDPSWAEDFAPNGTRVGEGDVVTRKRYARTLEAIATYGLDVFYKGALAEATVKALRRKNGTITMEDMAGYNVVSRKPASIEYKGFRMHACSAPASGAVTLSVLKILEGYPDMEESDLSTHRMDEAIRFGYGKRASLGDPNYVKDLDLYEAGILDEAYAQATRARISDKHTLNVSDYDPDGFESLEDHGTSHIVTADSSGMATSLTTTINLFFGSRIMVPETGVIMNNEMADFSLPNTSNIFGYYPSPTNYIHPLSRPLSSISPLIASFAKNGTLFAVLGASGGSRIITTVIQNALSVLDLGMTAHEALMQPRLHDQLLPNQVTFEFQYNNATIESMRGRGHNVTWGVAGSSAQAIRIQDGVFEAVGEPRQWNSGGLTA